MTKIQPNPAHSYYKVAEGHWRGHMILEIIDCKSFREELRIFDQILIKILLLTQNLFGLGLRTTVEAIKENRVCHLFELTCGCLVLYKRWSYFDLDGSRSGTVTAMESQLPLFWRRHTVEGVGELIISEEGDCSDYVMYGLKSVWRMQMKLSQQEAHSMASCSWGKITEVLKRST